MKHIFLVILFLLFLSSHTSAQIPEYFDDEPAEDIIGAPLYPGAEFIRITKGLNPYYETAMYITLLPMNMVEDFFEKKIGGIGGKRVVYYSDEDVYLTAYLLKTWSKFPGKPTKDDLPKLRREPSVQIRFYDPNRFEPLAKYYGEIPEGKIKANFLRNGKTMILYSYEKPYEDKSPHRIIATWRETSRDLEEYYGSILEFRPDGTYTFTFTAENIDAIAKNPALRKRFSGMSINDIRKHIEELNPEKGRFNIMRNKITMVSRNPIDGINKKSGLATIGSATLSLKLIRKPRLTFLRKPSQRELRQKNH